MSTAITKPKAKKPPVKQPALKVIKMGDSPEEQAIARFAFCHRLAQTRGLQFKLAAYFAGLEVATLSDLHEVSQGKAAKNGEAWGAFVPRALGIPYSTAMRYKAHYSSMATEHAAIAKKLNSHWLKLTDGTGTAKLLTSGGEDAVNADLTATALQDMCDHADEWGLHEIFAKPAKETDTGGDDDDDEETKRRKNPLVDFYARQLMQRFASQEYLRLPKAQLATFATRAEEAAKKAREALATPKTKGGKKS